MSPWTTGFQGTPRLPDTPSACSSSSPTRASCGRGRSERWTTCAGSCGSTSCRRSSGAADVPARLGRRLDDSAPSVPSTAPTTAAAGSGAWLSMARVVPPDAPAVPPALVPWLDARAARDFAAEHAPALREQADELMDDEQRLAVRQSLASVHEAWAARWELWAAERRRVDPAVRAYNELYAMAAGAKADAELFELVLGFGYVTQTSGRDAVRRHVVTARAVAAYDLRTGAVTVGPDPEFPGAGARRGHARRRRPRRAGRGRQGRRTAGRGRRLRRRCRGPGPAPRSAADVGPGRRAGRALPGRRRPAHAPLRPRSGGGLRPGADPAPARFPARWCRRCAGSAS